MRTTLWMDVGKRDGVGVRQLRGCIVRICIPASKRVANFTWDWLSGGFEAEQRAMNDLQNEFRIFSIDELTVASGVSLSLNAPSIQNTLSIDLSLPKMQKCRKNS